MFRILLKWLGQISARTYSVTLVLGTVALCAVLSGILPTRVANSQNQRYSHEIPAVSRTSTASDLAASRAKLPDHVELAIGRGGWSTPLSNIATVAASSRTEGLDTRHSGLTDRLVNPLLLGAAFMAASLGLTVLLAGRIMRPLSAFARVAVGRVSSVSKVNKVTRALIPNGFRQSEAEAASHESEDVRDRKLAEAVCVQLTEGLGARVAEEIAAQQAAEASLSQAQRMQALGQLASGIAHDFNNVLQAIGGALFLIAQRPDDPVRVARFAALAENAAFRGANITGRLLSLSRRVELHRAPINPAPLLSGMAEILSHTLDANIAISVDARLDLPPLLADRGQLETVLINLATNARDAMPGGGTLQLSATLDRGMGRSGHGRESEAAAPYGYILIGVSDTGEGMDAATLARASEPFFTTKAAGCGTGLGLAMALGFANQSGGALQINSVLGEGTTVRLWLPCADAAAVLSEPDPAQG